MDSASKIMEDIKCNCDYPDLSKNAKFRYSSASLFPVINGKAING